MLALLLAAAVLGPARSGGTARNAGAGSAAAFADSVAWSRGNRLLTHRIELASRSAFYLLLDLPRARLVLFGGGALLQEYPLEGVEVGVPRVRGLQALAPEWETRIWSEGTLLPPRRPSETLERALGTGSSGETPPLPEEAFPAPSIWRLRFASGLEVEVVATAEEGGPSRPGFWHRAGTVFRNVGDGFRRRPAVRTRILMAADEAGSLYRALPSRVDLLLGGEPPADAPRGVARAR